LDGLTEKVWQLKDGQIKEHLGDVSLYLEKLKEELQNETLQKQETKQVEKSASSNKERFERKKELDKQYRKINNRISKLERDIEDFEASQKDLEKKVYEGDQSQELFDQLAEIQKNLALVMKEWEEKSYELEVTEEERSEL
jgi:ATP-binding cassette subfamily F protein 3